jgi:cytochrome c peroxidase
MLGAAKLAGIAQSAELRGRFRTKSLRHVAETAPYLHNGSIDTLEEGSPAIPFRKI